MFTGVSLDQALEYWKAGKEVIVLDRTVKSPAGGYETYSLDELFKNLELLADVPASIPEVKLDEQKIKKAIVQEIRAPGVKGATGDPKGAVGSSEEKNDTPPPQNGRR